MQSRTAHLSLLVAAISLTGCGVKNFTDLNGGPSRTAIESPKVFVIECRDSFGLTGHTNLIGQFAEGNATAQKEFWMASCSYEGKPLPWLVTGVLHAGMFRHDEWAEFKDKLVQRGAYLGCPGVAVRSFPPTVGSLDEAVGALCIDMGQAPRYAKDGGLNVVSNASDD
jgi:hypothetical protein